MASAEAAALTAPRRDAESIAWGRLWGLWFGCAFLLASVAFDDAYWIAIGTPIAIAIGDRGPTRILAIACALGAVIALYGSAGAVTFFGASYVQATTVATAIHFAATMSLGMAAAAFFSAGFGERRQALVSRRTHQVVIALACLVLLTRFQDGIPLLAGNDARLAGVASINPYLGLASGILPIVASFLVSDSSRVTRFGQVVLVILVAGVASRLLLGAVLLGFISNSALPGRQLRTRTKVYIAVLSIGALVALLQVYSLRTDVSEQSRFEAGAASIGGVAGAITEAVGPSAFYSSRNGLVLHEIIEQRGLHPPAGYFVGGLKNTFRLGADPERWLTEAMGYELGDVGALATPVWSGASVDFRPLVTFALAFAIGFALLSWAARFPSLTWWAAFAVVLSFYGSYLVAPQFIFSSAILTALMWSASRMGTHR